MATLDETWADCFEEYKKSLIGMGPFSASIHPDAEAETLLSATETMEPRTDPLSGWNVIKSLKDLVALGTVAKPDTLTEDILCEAIDGILCLEVRYLQGFALTQSMVSFAYFHMVNECADVNQPLYAYLKAALKCLHLVLKGVFSVGVRDDEEFMHFPMDFEIFGECSASEVSADLDKAIASTKSPALKSRLSFRREYLRALDGFLQPTDITLLESCQAAEAASKILESCVRTSEPVLSDKYFRPKEVPVWLPIQTPVKELEQLTYAASTKVFTTLLSQLASVQGVFKLHTLYSVIDFIEDLALQQPLLPVRCLALLAIASEPTSLFCGGSMYVRVLETLTVQYGAPMYEKIANQDARTVNELVDFRSNHIENRKQPLTPAVVAILKSHTVDSTRSWAVEAGRMFLALAETLMCSRGRCHRRLANMIPDLSRLQQASWDLDVNTFCAMTPGNVGTQFAQQNERDVIMRSMVLSAFVTDLLLYTMTLYLQLTIELQLLTPEETLPTLWYMNYLCGSRLENFISLYVPSAAMIPEKKVLRKGGPPSGNSTITSRTPALPPGPLVMRIEATRLISDAALLFAAVAESEKCVDLSNPSTSLITTENIFNHRFMCFTGVHRPGFFPYAYCKAQISQYQGAKDKIPACLQQASHAAKQAAENIKQYAQDAAAPHHRFFVAAEKTAKNLFVSINLFNAMCQKEDSATVLSTFVVGMEYPFHPSLLAVTLKPAAAALKS